MTIKYHKDQMSNRTCDCCYVEYLGENFPRGFETKFACIINFMRLLYSEKKKEINFLLMIFTVEVKAAVRHFRKHFEIFVQLINFR